MQKLQDQETEDDATRCTAWQPNERVRYSLVHILG